MTDGTISKDVELEERPKEAGEPLAVQASAGPLPVWKMVMLCALCLGQSAVFSSVSTFIVPQMILLFINRAHACEAEAMVWVVPAGVCIISAPIFFVLTDLRPCIARFPRRRFSIVVGAAVTVCGLLVLGLGAKDLNMYVQCVLLTVCSLGSVLSFSSWLGLVGDTVCRQQLLLSQLLRSCLGAAGGIVGIAVSSALSSSLRYAYTYYVLVAVTVLCTLPCFAFPEPRHVPDTRFRLSQVLSSQFMLLDSTSGSLLLLARVLTFVARLYMLQYALLFMVDSFAATAVFGRSVSTFTGLGVLLGLLYTGRLCGFALTHTLLRRAVCSLGACLYTSGILTAVSVVIPALFQTSFAAAIVSYTLFGLFCASWNFSLEILCKRTLPTSCSPHDRNLGVFWLCGPVACFICMVPIGALLDAFIRNGQSTLGHALVHTFLAILCLIATAIVTFVSFRAPSQPRNV